MGGPLVVKTAAALPNRIGAGASFHGGGLVTDKQDSPHLLASKIKARMYFGIASNDDMRQPDAKDKLREAFTAAKVSAEIEVYSGALHGWCVSDMPMQNGAPIYSKPDAERAWANASLYKGAPILANLPFPVPLAEQDSPGFTHGAGVSCKVTALCRHLHRWAGNGWQPGDTGLPRRTATQRGRYCARGAMKRHSAPYAQ
jgi:hypothetical protein